MLGCDTIESSIDGNLARRRVPLKSRTEEPTRTRSYRKAENENPRDTQDLLQSTMDALSAQVAIVDGAGRIVVANTRWRRFSGHNGSYLLNPNVGANYLAACDAAASISQDAARTAAGLRSVLDGTCANFGMDHMCETSEGTRWYRTRATWIGSRNGRFSVIAREDITEMKRAEKQLCQHAAQLLKAQDDERRRIARDLHDTTTQNLVAAGLLVDQLNDGTIAHEADRSTALDEVRELLDRSLQELRTLSYLLHPPMLDELGLVSALRWYVRGFEKRSGLSVKFDALDNMPRLPTDAESALFRVVQEALCNVHRHSGSADAEIIFGESARQITLEIVDHGRGMPNPRFDKLNGEAASLGVGIPGMRLRLRQLGGTFEVVSNCHGTRLRATVPLGAIIPETAPIDTVRA